MICFSHSPLGCWFAYAFDCKLAMKGTENMSTFYIGKECKLDMAIEVEADSYEEAVEKVENAWENNPTFVNNYFDHAASFENSTYAASPADYGMTLEELCE